MITICIGKADAQCTDKITLTSGMVQAVQVLFDFSEEWAGLTKIAVFSNGETTLDIPLDESDRCHIPHEVLEVAGKDVTCGIYGSNGDESEYVAIPTVECVIGKVAKGVCPAGVEPAEPTPTMLVDHEKRITALENNGGGGSGGGGGATKMSQLEQDLESLKFKNGIMTYSDTGIKPSGMSTFGINAFDLSISGHEISIGGNTDSDEVHISNLVAPKADTDAANKKYVDDITGDISTALDTIIAMQSQYVGVSE